MFPRFLATIWVLLLGLIGRRRGRRRPPAKSAASSTDPSGAPMPGVTITLTNQGTNAVREVQTNESGLYVMPAIPPGVYTLKATLTGFRTLGAQATSRCRWAAPAASRSRWRSAQLTEVVEITGGAPLLQTANSAVGTVIENRGDRRAAAERPQLPAARLADPRRDDQRALVEPGQAAHGRATQQLRAERRRPAHPLQPLLARRRSRTPT